jgi:hypothetical protein
MAFIEPFDYNMRISTEFLEWRPENPIVAVIHNIALYTIIPFAMIVVLEAVFKNIIVYNIANLAITCVINKVHELFFKREPA